MPDFKQQEKDKIKLLEHRALDLENKVNHMMEKLHINFPPEKDHVNPEAKKIPAGLQITFSGKKSVPN
jgi:hypothetical protein